MTGLRTKLAALLVTTACIFATACSVSDVVTISANAAIVAADTATAWLSQNKTISPAEAGVLVSYTTSAVTAVKESITEWQSSDSGIVKGQKIYGYIDSVVLPDLSTLAPQDALLFTLIDTSIKSILADVASSTGVASSVTAKAVKVKTRRLTVAERTELTKLKAEATAKRVSTLDVVKANADRVLVKLSKIK